jgi:hypothetical protein
MLPATSMALTMPVTWTSDNTLGPNTASLTVRLQCSGILCGLVGFGSPYQQTQTSQLTGGGVGTLDDVADTIVLDGSGLPPFEFTGTNVTFTGIPVFGNVQASNIYVALLNAATGSIPGFDLPQNAQSIATTLPGGQWYTSADTNNATIPTIEIGPVAISSAGTLNEIGTNGLGQPLYELHDLRGAFQFLTATSISGVTIRSTFRATFTLNLRGVGAIPEPGTVALLGGGLAAFGAAAARRRRSS